MSPRKRRREQAFPDEEIDTPPVLNEEELDKQRAEKEQEVWDAIRETHYEAIEQLPLTLHRQLSLMHQLDEQTHTYTASLLPALQKYIRLRRAMAGISEDPTGTQSQDQPVPGPSTEHESPPTESIESSQLDSAPKTPAKTQSSNGKSRSTRSPLRTSTPGSVPENDSKAKKQPETTRELITHVAWMAEELLRASQEKVNLAQANHESVERHIRLIDQAIKEQESSLSGDTARTSNGIVVHLPEVLVPVFRNSRNPTRALTAELLDDEGDIFNNEVSDTLGQASLMGKGKEGQRKDSSSLTITLPATSQNEELYCYCNRVSFGEMIACDSQSCAREWFHLGCVGLTEIPEGEWYCEDCKIDEGL